MIRFEECQAWQEARELTKYIYQITTKAPLSRDYGLKDQIRRASSSIMLNIAEGFDSGTDPQFTKFLYYALRSCSEVQSILYICLDNSYLDQEVFNYLFEKSQTIKKLCSGLIRYLKK